MLRQNLPTACLTALSICSSWFCGQAAPPSADRSAERLVRAAAERIAANYNRIPTFRVRMRTTLHSPGVKEPTRYTAEFEAPPEGGVQARRAWVEVEVSPVITWNSEIIARGDDRASARDGDSGLDAANRSAVAVAHSRVSFPSSAWGTHVPEAPLPESLDG